MPTWKQIIGFLCILVAISLFPFSGVLMKFYISCEQPVASITMLIAMILLLIIGIRDIRSKK